MASNRFFGRVNQSDNTGTDGIVVLETNANTVTGTANNTAVTPSGLTAKLGSQTANGVIFGQGSTSSLGVTAAGTSGQLLIGGSSAPAFNSLTSTGGTIVYTAGNNTLNLEAASGGMPWTVITGASQAMTKSNGYFANRAGTVAFTLPATMAVGDTFAISNMAGSATGWTLATGAAGQYIRFGNQTTTVTSGTLASTATGDSVRLVCSVANTEVVVQSSIGNITIT